MKQRRHQQRRGQRNPRVRHKRVENIVPHSNIPIVDEAVPVGIVIGAAVGAGLGRASTHWFDHGLLDTFVRQLQMHLQPNTSALILLVEHHYLKPLSEQMEGVVMQYTLTDEVVEQMLKEQQGHKSS